MRGFGLLLLVLVVASAVVAQDHRDGKKPWVPPEPLSILDVLENGKQVTSGDGELPQHSALLGKNEKDDAFWQKEILRLTAIICENPCDALAYKFRGMAWACKKDFSLAIKDFDESLRLCPVQADVYTMRGYARWAKGLKLHEEAHTSGAPVDDQPSDSLLQEIKDKELVFYGTARQLAWKYANGDASAAHKIELNLNQRISQYLSTRRLAAVRKGIQSGKTTGLEWQKAVGGLEWVFPGRFEEEAQYALNKDLGEPLESYVDSLASGSGWRPRDDPKKGSRDDARKTEGEKALDDVDRAIRIDPKCALPYFYRAHLRLETWEVEKKKLDDQIKKANGEDDLTKNEKAWSDARNAANDKNKKDELKSKKESADAREKELIIRKADADKKEKAYDDAKNASAAANTDLDNKWKAADDAKNKEPALHKVKVSAFKNAITVADDEEKTLAAARKAFIEAKAGLKSAEENSRNAKAEYDAAKVEADKKIQECKKAEMSFKDSLAKARQRMREGRWSGPTPEEDFFEAIRCDPDLKKCLGTLFTQVENQIEAQKKDLDNLAKLIKAKEDELEKNPCPEADASESPAAAMTKITFTGTLTVTPPQAVPAATGTATANLADAAEKINKAAGKIEDAGKGLGDAGTKLDKAGVKLDAAGGKLDALGTKLDAAGGKLDAAGGKLDAAGGKLDAAGGKLDAAASKFVDSPDKFYHLFAAMCVGAICGFLGFLAARFMPK